MFPMSKSSTAPIFRAWGRLGSALVVLGSAECCVVWYRNVATPVAERHIDHESQRTKKKVVIATLSMVHVHVLIFPLCTK